MDMRKQLLGGGVVALVLAAALAAALGTERARAATGDPVVGGHSGNTGNQNLAEDATEIRYDGGGNPGVVFLAQADGTFSPSASVYPAALAGWTSTNPNITTGVYGYSARPAGTGVVGVAGFEGSGNGVVGETGSTVFNAAGVRGDAFALSGQVVGVYGSATNSPIGTGVVGVGSATGGYFRADGPGGRALYVEGPAYVQAVDGGSNATCFTDDGLLANCSSSLRYKRDVRSFSGGLDVVSRLQPIAFTWKQGGKHDLGLAAEDVARVEPLLTFRNKKGEIEGVKYNQLSAVFVNAIRDQQAQIERQREQIAQQEGELAALKALVCASHAEAGVCR
jgi:hypothetical protein